MLALAFTVGCSNSNAPASVDAPVDGSADAGTDADAGPSPCNVATICSGADVYACANGKVGDRQRTCSGAEVCSEGRCTSPACQGIENGPPTFVGLGCRFYAFQADNVDSDAQLATSFLVTNPGPNAASVSLQGAAPGDLGTSWAAVMPPSQIDPFASVRLSVSNLQVAGAGRFADAALRVESDQPVTVAVIHSDDANEGEVSSAGGTMVLPIQTIGTKYRAMTYPQVATTSVAGTPGGLGGAARIAIVGTQSGTSVTVTLPPNTTASASSSGPPFTSGAPFPLDDGEVFQLYSANEGDDLSGCEITSTRPVAVFSGNMTTTYGRATTGINSPDMAHEQMPPVSSWSLSWVAAALPPQAATCDSLLGAAGASIWRILASVDETTVTFHAPPGVVGLDPPPPTLKAGEVLERVVSGGSFTISAKYPVLVTQGIDCEPSLSLAVSTENLLSDLSFAVLPNFDQAIAVVRRTGETILLDDVPIDDSAFVRVADGFDVAQLPLPVCAASAGTCPHRLLWGGDTTMQNGGFGVTLRGMDVLASYALTAPTLRNCAILSDPMCRLQ